MEYREVIFYLSLLLIVGSLAEIYVRMKGLGQRTEKVRGVYVKKPERFGPPIALLIAAIAVAVMSIPH
jgi:hypothetical protein